MPFAEQGNQQKPDDLTLPDDDVIDILDDVTRGPSACLRIAQLQVGRASAFASRSIRRYSHSS
jgi:hypothetical protein